MAQKILLNLNFNLFLRVDACSPRLATGMDL